MMNLLNEVFKDSATRNNNPSFLQMARLFIFSTAGQVLPLYRLCQIPKHKILQYICKKRYARLCDRYNVFLPIETKIEKGLQFPHYFPVVINPHAQIGENCIIHPCVLIGRDRAKEGAPVIGDNVFIGHGAKIIGNPVIGSWSFISPNSVITKDVNEGSIMGGVNKCLGTDGKRYVELYMK